MIKIAPKHWRITVTGGRRSETTMVDGGDFKTYAKEITSELYGSFYIFAVAQGHIDSMDLNSIHKLTLERIEERTMKDGEVKELRPGLEKK